MPIDDMSLDDRINLLKSYLAAFNPNDIPFGYGQTPREYLETCNKLKILGHEWGHKLSCGLNTGDIKLLKGKQFYINNKATSYEFDPDTYYVVWDNGNVGRLMFINETYYTDVNEEWEAFEQKLLSFSPLDYDTFNNKYVYDIENGKKLIDAYRDICFDTKNAMGVKIKEAKRKRLLYQLRKLDEEDA